jgi:hypothetical protein
MYSGHNCLICAAAIGHAVTVKVTKSGYPGPDERTEPTAAVAEGAFTPVGSPTVEGPTAPAQTLHVALPELPGGATTSMRWRRAGVILPGERSYGTSSRQPTSAPGWWRRSWSSSVAHAGDRPDDLVGHRATASATRLSAVPGTSSASAPRSPLMTSKP